MPTTILDGESHDDARRRRFREKAEVDERTSRRVIPSSATDPRQLAAELRERINPAYADTIGTESHERRLSAEAIESLLEQQGDLIAAGRLALDAINSGQWQMPMSKVDLARRSLNAAIEKAKS